MKREFLMDMEQVYRDEFAQLAEHLRGVSDADFDQASWCGCVGGHAMVMDGHFVDVDGAVRSLLNDDRRIGYVADMAPRKLGLEHWVSHWLLQTHWPAKILRKLGKDVSGDVGEYKPTREEAIRLCEAFAGNTELAQDIEEASLDMSIAWGEEVRAGQHG